MQEGRGDGSFSQPPSRQTRKTSGYHNTGFNWNKVDVNSQGLDESMKGQSRSPGYREKPKKNAQKAPQKAMKTPQQILDDIKKSKERVPIGHKVVSEEEFDRLTKENMAKDGIPMVEKTIFIVKPIYINADELGSKGRKGGASKQKIQKQIYSEKMKPPSLISHPTPGKHGRMPKLNLHKKRRDRINRKERSPTSVADHKQEHIVSINNIGSMADSNQM